MTTTTKTKVTIATKGMLIFRTYLVAEPKNSTTVQTISFLGAVSTCQTPKMTSQNKWDDTESSTTAKSSVKYQLSNLFSPMNKSNKLHTWELSRKVRIPQFRMQTSCRQLCHLLLFVLMTHWQRKIAQSRRSCLELANTVPHSLQANVAWVTSQSLGLKD